MEPVDRQSSLPAAATGDVNEAARRAAAAAVVGVQTRPAPLISYESKGSVVIIGPSKQALEAAGRLAPMLECLVVATGEGLSDAQARPPGGWHPSLYSGQVARVEGYLGRFRIELDTGGRAVDLLRLAASSRDTVDLVLDLDDPPWIRSQLPPPGYFASRGDPAALETALEQLPELVGHFEKPQFFVYDPAICAHSRSGVQACTRCIDACPADAIQSNGDLGIKVNTHLCQGAGSCAGACPSGAIRYDYPGLGESLERLQKLLKAYRNAGGTRPIVLFHDAQSGAAWLDEIYPGLPGNVLPLGVAELGSVGMDQWLAAFAFGAVRVLLLSSRDIAASVTAALQAQLGVTRALLDGMGYPSGALVLISEAAGGQIPPDLLREGPELQVEAAAFACLDDKRAVLRLALDHLFHQAPARRPLITLPAGAAFGEVTVVQSDCTLCMACVSQCPGKALMEGGDLPQLRFVEDNCIQCGMCSRVCPENAIAPSPRYLFSSAERRRVRVLKEEPPFLCTHCGKPFATQSVIRRITQKLQGHPNFDRRGLERLRMCEDCRVKALFEEELSRRPPGRQEVRS